jgi:hypothetical protein
MVTELDSFATPRNASLTEISVARARARTVWQPLRASCCST